MITNYKYDNMIIKNNRTIFKNFEEFELCNNKHMFPIQISEVELNLMEDDYECVLYINNHVEVSRFIIDDIFISKNLSIKNNLKEIILIESIIIDFHYKSNLVSFVIRTNINEYKNFPLKQELVELKNVLNPLSILENKTPNTFIDPMATFNPSPVNIDLSKDEEIDYTDEDDLFIDENEEIKPQCKTVIGTDDIMKDIGGDITFDEDFDDLI